MAEMMQAAGASQVTDQAGLAGSPLAERAQRLLADRTRARKLARHRRWIGIAGTLGLLFLVASLAVLKFDLAQSPKAQQFAALVAIFGFLLLATGLFVGWHSSASERQLFRLALLRSNLDSVEATAEVVRMRARLTLALQQCEEAPEWARAEIALQMLEALNYLDQREQSSVVGSGLPAETAERLLSLGVHREVLEELADGKPMPSQTGTSNGAQAPSRAA